MSMMKKRCRRRRNNEACLERYSIAKRVIFSMSQNKNNFPKEKSNRIVLFVDLRDSTEILMNFEQEIYRKRRGQSETGGRDG
jgi:ERCC4-related helicase